MKRISYTQDEFLRLMTQIEEEGGHQAEDEHGYPLICADRTFTFSGPHGKPLKLDYCNHEAVFEVVYDPTQPVQMELPVYELDQNDELVLDGQGEPVVKRMEFIDHPGESGPRDASVRVCAVEDTLGWWPRYASVMGEGT